MEKRHTAKRKKIIKIGCTLAGHSLKKSKGKKKKSAAARTLGSKTCNKYSFKKGHKKVKKGSKVKTK